MLLYVMLLAGIEWLYYVALPIVGALLLIIVLIIVINHLKKKKFLLERQNANNELISCFGGRDNIISAHATGSRLAIVLRNYDLFDDVKVKKLGVTTILKMSNKITLVIGEEDAKLIENLIKE